MIDSEKDLLQLWVGAPELCQAASPLKPHAVLVAWPFRLRISGFNGPAEHRPVLRTWSRDARCVEPVKLAHAHLSSKAFLVQSIFAALQPNLACAEYACMSGKCVLQARGRTCAIACERCEQRILSSLTLGSFQGKGREKTEV